MAGVDTSDPKDLPEIVEYEVTIKRITRNVKSRDHEYKDLGTTKKNNYGEDEKEYGYVYFDTFTTKEAEIYNQRVDELDLPAVIKAVNKMEQ